MKTTFKLRTITKKTIGVTLIQAEAKILVELRVGQGVAQLIAKTLQVVSKYPPPDNDAGIL